MSAAVEFAEVGGGNPQYKVANAVFKVVMRSPLAKRMEPMWILEVEGRRSGRRISTPVGLHDVDGQQLMVAGGNWRFNFADDGGRPLALRRGSTTRTGRGELVTDLDRVVEVYDTLLQRYGAERDVKGAARMVGAQLPQDRLPSRDELRTALADGRRSVVHVTLDPAA